MGTSKLGVLKTLKTSKEYFRRKRSFNLVSFTIERSIRFCQDCRKMLRWPDVKPVSKGSFIGMAPPNAPGARIGSVKQAGLSASPLTPFFPVSADFGVQPAARGTMGLVMPSETP